MFFGLCRADVHNHAKILYKYPSTGSVDVDEVQKRRIDSVKHHDAPIRYGESKISSKPQNGVRDDLPASH